MRSVTERHQINKQKSSTTERAAQVLSANFLTQKYEVARVLLVVLWNLKLIVNRKWLLAPYGMQYHADKLTQRHTFKEWDVTRWQRGVYVVDPSSVCVVPAWFSQSLDMDKD